MSVEQPSNFTTEGFNEDGPPPTKRPRLETAQVCDAENVSIKSMLSVPLDLIFREIHEKPLLTRAEGQCFMRINLVAQEMDALVLLAEKMLLQRQRYHLLRHKFHEGHNPIFQAVAILASIFEQQPIPALRVVQSSISEFIMELSSRSSLLRQSAEQNWSVSESLLEAMGGHSSQSFARDKRNLAELEEEVCKRIDCLVTMASFDYQEEKRLSMPRKTLGTRRNLFGRLPRNTEDLGKEPMKNVYSNLFCSGPQEKLTSGIMMKTKAYTQPDEPRTQPSQGTEETFELQEIEESQNSIRKKSIAAEVLANFAIGGQKE